MWNLSETLRLGEEIVPALGYLRREFPHVKQPGFEAATIFSKETHMKFLSVLIAVGSLSFSLAEAHSLQALRLSRATVVSQQTGPTPFISFLSLVLSQPTQIKSIEFTIAPKPGSVTRPISVNYSRNYLLARGYFDGTNPPATLPVFGLYANYSNTVVLTYRFMNGSSQQETVVVATGTFADPCGFNNRIVIQPRTNTTDLSYDFMLLKNFCGQFSPTILDTDGEIRWVGTAGVTDAASIFFQNAIYLGKFTTLYRIEFDGAVSILANYPNTSFHHNIDPGKRGIILQQNTSAQVESFFLEVDAAGHVLQSWDLAAIVSSAMIAGGDDPTQFVFPSPGDWFHSNSATYRKSDDSLVISSRENFVISLDYATAEIKWILGDSTKRWHQFASLTAFALDLGLNSLPPIGQHALSFTDDDKLLLFDNGRASLDQNPPGEDRTYSAPRKYDLDLATSVATEIWNYPNGQALYSPYCSSIYEDLPSNYLIDYAILNFALPERNMELLGLTASGAKVFHYRYPTNFCDEAWNSIPIHLERAQFTTVVPNSAVSRKVHGAAGTFDLPLSLGGSPGIEPRSGGAGNQYQVVVTFPAAVTLTGATVTPEPGGTASVSGVPVVSDNEVTINLTGVSNAQTMTVNLVDLSDGSATDTVSVPMSILTGDTNQNGSVNASDVAQTKSQAGQPATAANYRKDVTASGSVNASDVAIVKSFSGTSLQGPQAEPSSLPD
jgi:hypothetical protein